MVSLETGMLFRSNPRPNALGIDESVDTAVHALTEYSRVLKESGSKLVVIPVPEKETVYSDWIPERYDPEPDVTRFLETLAPALREAGVATVDLLRVYSDQRRADDRLLYQLDDTHWTEHGVKVAVEAFLAEVGRVSGPSK